MSFSEILKEAVHKVEGAESAVILGADGMIVEEYSKDKLVNLEDLSAEASQMIRDIKNAAESLKLGNAREFSIISDLCGIIVRKINEEYFLALVIRPEGNYGKGRFILRTLVPRLEGEF